MSFAYSWQASHVPCAYTPLCLPACGFMQKKAHSVPPVTSRLCAETLHSSGNTLPGYLYDPNRNNIRASFICVLWKILTYRDVSICKSLCNRTDRFVGVTPWLTGQGLQCDGHCEQWLQEATAQRCLELWCAIVSLTVKPWRRVGSILRVHTSLWNDGLLCTILFPIHCFHTLYTHTHMYLTVLQWAYLQETNNLISLYCFKHL